MTLAAIIRGVQPKNTAKWLEGELGCSPRQSWRIVQEGRVARTLRQRLVSVLDEAIARNERELRRLRHQLRLLEDDRTREAAHQMARVPGAFDEIPETDTDGSEAS